MRYSKSFRTLFLWLFSFSFFYGCAQNPSQQETTQVCDSTDCIDRPIDDSSDNPDTAGSSNDSEGQIHGLEDLARQDPRAAYDLGLKYFRGDGVRQDSYLALQWMREAAERGNLGAQKAIGRMYLTGLEEMGPDPREAEKWLKITVARGDKEAAKLLKEAQTARKDEQQYFLWRNQWRTVFYNAWSTGYRYHWHWRSGRWHLH